MTRGDIANFLEELPRTLTFSEMAEECRRQFGERAWSRSRIVRHWYRIHPARKGTASRLDCDADVRSFVEDRLGRLTLDQIVGDCRREFGEQRAPSRSSIHRHFKKVRRGNVRR